MIIMVYCYNAFLNVGEVIESVTMNILEKREPDWDCRLQNTRKQPHFASDTVAHND